MTTTETTYNTEKKIQLLNDILKVLFPTVRNLTLEDNRKASFTYPITQMVEKKYFIRWNENLDFDIWAIGTRGSLHDHFIPSSKWFIVQDILRRRFLDAEKLKM